ncbi:MAG: hypothetical protein OHK0037_16390 [Elainellaceae cyanobacterium]
MGDILQTFFARDEASSTPPPKDFLVCSEQSLRIAGAAGAIREAFAQAVQLTFLSEIALWFFEGFGQSLY